MNYYTQAFKHYFDFSGRATRKEFWMFVLFNIIISFIVGFIAGLIGVKVLNAVYNLLVLIPSISITVRRLRDAGLSVWWILIGLIPFLGALALLIMAIKKSVPANSLQN